MNKIQTFDGRHSKVNVYKDAYGRLSVEFSFDEFEARGNVFLSECAYGIVVSPTVNQGERDYGLIDLYYNSDSWEETNKNGPPRDEPPIQFVFHDQCSDDPIGEVKYFNDKTVVRMEDFGDLVEERETNEARLYIEF